MDHGVRTNMASSWGGKPHAPYVFNHNAIGEMFETKFVKLKIGSDIAMAKVAIDNATLDSLVINRRFSFQIGILGSFVDDTSRCSLPFPSECTHLQYYCNNSLQSRSYLVGFLVVFTETVCICTVFYISQNVSMYLLECAPVDVYMLGLYRNIWGKII